MSSAEPPSPPPDHPSGPPVPVRVAGRSRPRPRPRDGGESGELDRGGDVDAVAYESIRALARRAIGPHGARHTLPPTAVANEAFLRLAAAADEPMDHRRLVAAAARAVRSVLVDHARARGRLRRGGDRLRVPLSNDALASPRPVVDALELDDALSTLARFDPRAASVVELRFFGGLGIAQTARCLDVSTATVERDWRFARAWLHRTLVGGPGESAADREADRPESTA